jgi:hypothetical protein
MARDGRDGLMPVNRALRDMTRRLWRRSHFLFHAHVRPSLKSGAMMKENEQLTLPAIARQVLAIDQRIAELDRASRELARRFDAIELRLAALASLQQGSLHRQAPPARSDAAASAGEDGLPTEHT